MGWDRLLELIPEPALLISDKGVSQNTAWRATLGAAPQSLSALASQLNCDDLTGRLQRCLSSGQDLVADVSFQCRLSRLYAGRLKAVPIDAHTLCCTLQSQQFKLFAELVTERGSTLAAVYDVENVMGPSLKWTSRPNLPGIALIHLRGLRRLNADADRQTLCSRTSQSWPPRACDAARARFAPPRKHR